MDKMTREFTLPYGKEYLKTNIEEEHLAEIRKGNPDADITILISTGLHRLTTVEELRECF